jgi:hypothetical protein
MKTTRTLLAVVAVTLIASRSLFATPVPEIDPGMGAGALAFLAGAIMVVRGRKKV